MIKAKMSLPNNLLDEAFNRIRELDEFKQDAIGQFILDMIADVDQRPIGGWERWARRIFGNDPTKETLFDAMRQTDHWRVTGEPTDDMLEDVEHLSMFADEEYEALQNALIERHRQRLKLHESTGITLGEPFGQTFIWTCHR